MPQPLTRDDDHDAIRDRQLEDEAFYDEFEFAHELASFGEES